MGCGASSQSGKAALPKKEVLALSPEMKTVVAKVNPEALGEHRDIALARRVFVHGCNGAVFLITTPAASTPGKVAVAAEAAEHAADIQPAENEAGSHDEAEPETAPADHGEAATRPSQSSSKEGGEIAKVRWIIFNDSRSELRLHATFFKADSVQVLSGAKMEEVSRTNGRLKTILIVPPGTTVPFVEGDIQGYMWRCEVKIAATGDYIPAMAFE